MSDTNEDVKTNEPLCDFIYANQLVDIVKHINPLHAARRPTYIRSNNHLDYILVSPDLVQSVMRAGHYEFHELIRNTDHCGV